MSKLYQGGATSQRTTILVRDATTLQGKTGLAFNTAGLAFAYKNGSGGTATSFSLVTQTVGGAWASGGFVEIDATKCPGAYQLDIPNATLAAGVTEALVQWKGTGILDDGLDIDIATFDPTTIDKTGFSLSSAGTLAIWDKLTSTMTAAGSIGKKVADWVLGADSKAVLSSSAHTGAIIPTVTALTQLTAASQVDNVTIVNALQICVAMLAGVRTGLTADGTAGTAVARNLQNTKNRVSLSHDGKGNLTTIVFDLT